MNDFDDLPPDPEHEDHHVLRRPEPDGSRTVIRHTDDRLGPGDVTTWPEDEDGRPLTAPIPGHMTLPVPLEDFHRRSEDQP